MTPRLIVTRDLSPLAFPLWTERLRTQYVSSEKWSDRVRRMSLKLESRTVVKPPRRTRELAGST